MQLALGQLLTCPVLSRAVGGRLAHRRGFVVAPKVTRTVLGVATVVGSLADAHAGLLGAAQAVLSSAPR